MKVTIEKKEIVIRIPIDFLKKKKINLQPLLTPSLGKLSVRLQQVATLIHMGKTNKEIATKLNISVRTVKFHVSLLLKKFKVRSRIELAISMAQGKIPLDKYSIAEDFTFQGGLL